MITLEQLSTPKKFDDALGQVIEIMKSSGFDTSVAEAQISSREFSWYSSSLLLTFAYVVATLWVKVTQVISLVTRNMRNSTAYGVGLDWYSLSHYDNLRGGGQTARGTVTLTDVSGDGPHTIEVGDIVVADSVTGVTFRNQSDSGTLPQGGTLDLLVECEQVGVIGNSPNGRVTVLKTTIAGVEVNNQPVSGSWLDRQGRDREADPELRRRNQLKWSTLSPNAPAAAYEWFALNARDTNGDLVGITKVDVSQPDGLGAFYVYIANAELTATTQQVTDVQAWIDDRRNPTADPTVVAASEVTVSPTVSVTALRGTTSTLTSNVQEVVADYINGLPIGGTKLDTSATGFVLLSEIIDAVMELDGVIDCKVTNPLSDIAIAQGEVAVTGTITVKVTEKL